jgi:hypothetical protein
MSEQPLPVDKEVVNDIIDEFAKLIVRYKSSTSAIVWGNKLMDHAIEICGIQGQVLKDRTAEIQQGLKDAKGKLVTHEMHFSIYANMVRDMVRGKIQRRYIPMLRNVSRMAVSYVMKDPLTIEVALEYADPYADQYGQNICNTVANYLSRVRPAAETLDMISETDFIDSLYDAMIGTYKQFLKDNWSTLAPNVDDE